LGLALSFVVSSTVAERFGWPRAFFLAGVPGLLLAILALLIADPRSRTQGQTGDHWDLPANGDSMSFWNVLRQVLSRPTMWWIIASGAIHNFNMYALGTFLASFLKRYHGVTVERAGHISALVYGFGALGIFAAGRLGDRAFRRSAGGRLRVAWVGVALAIPF